MGSSYAWHPGSRALDGRWPIQAPLLPDELFSSWLCRASLLQGSSPVALAGSLWPRWRAWAGDIDRSITLDRLGSTASEAGLLLEPLEKSTVAFHARKLTVRPRSHGLVPWLLPTGARNLKRRSGPMFCSACLHDEPAYFRVSGRFAWHTVCARHGRMLDDRCPCCAAPVEPHRLGNTSLSLAECARCENDLRMGKPSSAPIGLIELQLIMDDLLRGRSLTYAGTELEPHSGFIFVRSMVNLLRNAARSANRESLVAFLAEVGINVDRPISPATGLAFELLPARERADLLKAAWQLISVSADRFVRLARAYGIDDLLACNLDPRPPAVVLSAWGLLQVTKTPQRRPRNSVKKSGPIPKHRIERAWARFKRRHDLP